jgi:hypothetical protein
MSGPTCEEQRRSESVNHPLRLAVPTEHHAGRFTVKMPGSGGHAIPRGNTSLTNLLFPQHARPCSSALRPAAYADTALFCN